MHSLGEKVTFDKTNDIFLETLENVKEKDNADSLDLTDYQIREDFSINRYFRRGSATHVQNSKVPTLVIESMNCWKRWKEPKAKRQNYQWWKHTQM